MSKVYYLRDAVHTDIKFEEKFFELINTKEFQRLSRIKQLSCEYLVFPTALHNRFSHSIGTFYVMNLLINRVADVLEKIDIYFDSYYKDLALCAALLHDIGHGPFSHTFEKITKNKMHEIWTVDIIKNENTEINHVLKKNFSDNFIDELADIFNKKDSDNEIINLIHQLISSKLDADRMDYLLRDSYFTGVSMGIYDVNRLISSLDVAKINDKLTICVNEKYISSIEEYILARFYMHKEAYQHPLKKQLENIIQKIFLRAKELYFFGKDIFCDDVMKNIFEEKLDIDSYLKMDDNFMMYHISRWKDDSDSVMKKLCEAFLHRKKFVKYREFDGVTLYDKLNNLLIESGKDKVDWNNEYCYICETVEIPVYDKGKENVWIKKTDGTIVDISEESHILSNISLDNKFVRKTEFYHKELLEETFGIVI